MTLPVNMKELVGSLKSVASFCAAPTERFIKLSQDTGEWSIGSDEEILDENSVFVLDPDSIKRGWSAFDASGKRVGEEMRSYTEAPLLREDLPKVDGEWMEQVGFKVYCIKGQDKGASGLIYQRSKGGRIAVAELISSVARQIEKEALFIPAFKLSWKFFTPKQKSFGKKRQPIFTHVDWLDYDTLTAAMATAEKTNVEDIVEGDVVEIVEPPRRYNRKK